MVRVLGRKRASPGAGVPELDQHVLEDADRCSGGLITPRLHAADLRYAWFIDPNGARDEVTEHVADDLNLPIEGQDPKPTSRRRDRFGHDRHLQAFKEEVRLAVNLYNRSGQQRQLEALIVHLGLGWLNDLPPTQPATPKAGCVSLQPYASARICSERRAAGTYASVRRQAQTMCVS
jgi:hypothetical protein